LKVVLDTNVLVSGLLNPFGAPGQIVRTVSSGTLELCHDSRILSEYREVLLRPKFLFQEKYVDDLLDQIQACGHPVSSRPLGFSLADPDDEPFLEVALSGQASYLITGNLKDYTLYKGKDVKVISPSDFIKLY